MKTAIAVLVWIVVGGLGLFVLLLVAAFAERLWAQRRERIEDREKRLSAVATIDKAMNDFAQALHATGPLRDEELRPPEKRNE